MIIPRNLRVVVILFIAFIGISVGVEFIVVPTSVESGKTYTITFSPTDGIATIILRKGTSDELDTIGTLTTSATGGKYEWTVDSSLPDGDDYALQIEMAGANPNFSGFISISGSSTTEDSTSLAGSPTELPNTQPTRNPVSSETSSPDTTSSPAVTNAPSSTLDTTGSATRTNPSSTSSSSNTSGSGPSGLSTGAKAGIGVGASLAGLGLALGAFFLGMTVRKKGRTGPDAESETLGGKPELEGKGVQRHDIPAEVDGNSAVVPIRAEELDSQQLGELPVAVGHEVEGSVPPTTPPRPTELSGASRTVESGSRVSGPPPQTPPGNDVRSESPVSSVDESTAPGIARQNTYDDPQLIQNPWAHDPSDAQNR